MTVVRMSINEIPAGLAFAAWKSAVMYGDRMMARCYETRFLRSVDELKPLIRRQYMQAYEAMKGEWS